MNKRVFNLIIVDESGSMSIIRDQAFAGMNETIETIITMQSEHKDIEQRVSLITFDSGHFKVHFDNVTADRAHRLDYASYNPCGATPLYDAIGKGISRVNAFTTPEDNVLVTIITDGLENCSKEYNLRMVKNLIEKLKKQNWTFAFIGTDNLDVEGMAHDMGIKDMLSFRQTDEGTRAMFKEVSACRRRYMGRVELNEKMDEGSFFDKDLDKNEEFCD